MKKKTEMKELKGIIRLLVRKEVRHDMISKAAYYRAEKRGFHNGDNINGDNIKDWLAAEEELDEKIMGAIRSNGSLPVRLTEPAVSKFRVRNNIKIRRPSNPMVLILSVGLFWITKKLFMKRKPW